ncbi:hypothetical protein [Paenibacillus lautus]|uniref:hypothetical protein n=1 Tax=Paenibacillus lautus TaxID=1401 RepID=UPI0027E002B0|nr:hypothetical protein [Paenibacillus lautus]
MITTVVFDLDGTLLDRDTSLVRFVQDQYDRLLLHDASVDREVYVRRFVELDRRGYVWKDQVYRQLIEEFALPLPWDTLLAITYPSSIIIASVSPICMQRWTA